METEGPPSDTAGSAEEADEPGSSGTEEEARSGRGVKRKNTSPSPSQPPISSSPSPAATAPATAATVFVTPNRDREEGKTSSAKKRRKSSSSAVALGKTALSPAASFNPAGMTERQQMAYLLQMTDPQKKNEESPAGSKEVTTPGRVHKRNERGETPLHVACIRGDLRLATSLIEQGAEVNATDHAGWTPLHEACNHGHPELVSLLLTSGARVNTRGMDGDTPLHDATINNHPHVVKRLMERGGDPHLANEKEQTPIDVCPTEELRHILTSSLQPRPQTTTDTPTSPLSGKNIDLTLNRLKPDCDSLDKTPKRRRTQSEGDSVFSPPLTPQSPLLVHHKKTSAPLVSDEAPLYVRTAAVVSSTPSRLRKRSKRERERGERVVFSDVSSSESDSEMLLVRTSRKAPRLVDRLPASVKEEGGGASRECEDVKREGGAVSEGSDTKVEKEGETLHEGQDTVQDSSGIVLINVQTVSEVNEGEEVGEKQPVTATDVDTEEKEELEHEEGTPVEPATEEIVGEKVGLLGDTPVETALEESSQRPTAGGGEMAAAEEETEPEKSVTVEDSEGFDVELLKSEQPVNEDSGECEAEQLVSSGERDDGLGQSERREEEDTTREIGMDQDTTERIGVDQDTTQVTVVDQDTTEEIGFDQDSTKPTGVDQDTGDKTVVDQDTSQQSGVDQDTTQGAGVDQDTTQGTGMDQDTTEHTGVDQDSIKLPEVDQDTADKTGMGQDTAEQIGVDQDTPEHPEVDQDIAEQPGVDQDSTEQSGVDRDTTQDTRVDQDSTKQSGVDQDTPKPTVVEHEESKPQEKPSTAAAVLASEAVSFEAVDDDLLGDGGGGEGVRSEGVKGEGGEGVKSEGGEGVRGEGGEGVKSEGGEGVRGEGGEGVRGEGGEGVKSEGEEDVKGEGGEGVKSEGGEGVKSEGGEDVRGEGGEGVKSEGGEGVKNEGVNGEGGEGVNGEGGEGVRGEGGESVKSEGVKEEEVEGEELKGDETSRVEEKETKEEEPMKLLLSIPFHHIKFKRGRGLSPLRIVRTPSRDKVPHEASMLVQHGRVESVSPLLLRGSGVRGESGLTVERMEIGSPQEHRGRGTTSEKTPKHCTSSGSGGRKTMQVVRKTKESVGRRVSGGTDDGDDAEGWGSGAEAVWETTPPGGTPSLGRITSHGRLASAGGWEGGVVPSRVIEDLPGSARASPTLSRASGHLSDEGEGDSDGLSDDSGSSGGTVVSLSTSLPIKFSGLQHHHQQLQRPSPLTTTAAAGSTAGDTSGPPSTAGGDVVSVSVSQAMEDKSSSPPSGSVSAVSSSQGERGGKRGTVAATTTAKESVLEMDESIPLPPKLRIRPVLRSVVVQQRREGAGRTPSLSHLPSFLLSPPKPHRHPHTPTNPKVVYPPIHSAMHKLFTEQETERVQLHSAHITQQDRLLQCMRQELVRAHQRATTTNSGHHTSPVSVCAVLLERMLPRADALGEDRPTTENTSALQEEGGEVAVDERLLGSLVQDVWDKFSAQRSLLVVRQRHEAEGLWLLQHQQWTDRLKELGLTHHVNFPTIHVPKLF